MTKSKVCTFKTKANAKASALKAKASALKAKVSTLKAKAKSKAWTPRHTARAEFKTRSTRDSLIR